MHYLPHEGCVRERSVNHHFRVAAAGQKVGDEFAELLLIYS